MARLEFELHADLALHISLLRRGRNLAGRVIVARITGTRGYALKRSFRDGSRTIAAHGTQQSGTP